MSADPPCPACQSVRTYTVLIPADHHYRCSACKVRWPIPGEWTPEQLAQEFRRLAALSAERRSPDGWNEQVESGKRQAFELAAELVREKLAGLWVQ